MPNEFANAQDLVSIDDIKEGTLVLKDGSLRQILMVSGVNFSLKSPEEQNTIGAAYQNFLNSIDFPLEIVVHSRKINIEKYLEDLARRAEEERSPLLQNQIKEYKEFIGSFVAENAIMAKTFLVVVPWHPINLPSKAGILSAIPFFKKNEAQENQKKTDDAAFFAQSLTQLKQRVGQVAEGLNTMGLDAVVLSDEELSELFYNLYNPGTTERESMPAAKEIPVPKPNA